jgi:hypothetical protein
MDKRKQELEAKRAKLAELRKAREDRKTTAGPEPTQRGSPDVGLWDLMKGGNASDTIWTRMEMGPALAWNIFIPRFSLCHRLRRPRLPYHRQT